MKSQSVYFALAALGISLSASPVVSIAQEGGQPKETQSGLAFQAGGLEVAEVTGTLDAAVGDKLRIKSEDGDDFIIVVNAQTTLDYSNTAEREFLMPGLMVRFVAPFNPTTGQPAASVSAIEIFRPVNRRRMTMAMRQAQTAGVYPIVDGPNDKGGNEKKGDTDKNAIPPAPNGAANFRIVGQLRGVQGDKIQVAAGIRPVMIDLAQGAQITVACGDTQFCMPGDVVEVNGLRSAAQPAWIQGQSIKIVGAKPLEIPENPLQKRQRSRRDKDMAADPSDAEGGVAGGENEPGNKRKNQR